MFRLKYFNMMGKVLFGKLSLYGDKSSLYFSRDFYLH